MRELKRKLIASNLSKVDLLNELKDLTLEIVSIKHQLFALEMKADRLKNMHSTIIDKKIMEIKND